MSAATWKPGALARHRLAGGLCAALLGSLLLACGGAHWHDEPGDAPPGDEVLTALEARHARARGDGTLRVSLGFAKGLTESRPVMNGWIVMEPSGEIEVEVVGLEVAVELWLLENRPGPGASTWYEPGDDAHLVGRIEPSEDGGPARLELELGSDYFDEMEVDRVLLCRVDAGPQGGVVLTGSPDVFQRMYARKVPASALTGLLAEGRRLFEEETFGGNGRTCATCHPSLNNFTIEPAFIATLPDDDPLFVAEFVPALAELENPLLMRSRGLILENLDGFDRPGVMRGVPHTLALGTSLEGPAIPFDNTFNPAVGVMPPAERTGWSGDGAPGSGSLRDFAMGAVIQHFPLTLARVAGQDFRLPTDTELDALEIFQLSLGRSEEFDLAGLVFRDPVVEEGRELFERLDTQDGSLPAGKCALCHSQAGANIDAPFFSNILGAPVSGNANFGTGVNELAALPADIVDGERNPRDGGFARVPHDGTLCEPERGGFGTVTPEGGILPPGLCEEDFNTPTLVEAADTAPFFHNNAVDTLEAAVSFYNDAAFNESPGGQILRTLDSGGVGIALDTSEVSAVASLLRVVNALENIRTARFEARKARRDSHTRARQRLARARAEQKDAIEVLRAGGLAAEASAALRRAGDELDCALDAHFAHSRRHAIERAIAALDAARAGLVVETAAK